MSDVGGLLTTVLGGKAVDGVISLGLLADKTREGIGGEAAGVTTASINLTNVDLDRGVILGSDQTVCGGANQRDKKENSLSIYAHIQKVYSKVRSITMECALF